MLNVALQLNFSAIHIFRWMKWLSRITTWFLIGIMIYECSKIRIFGYNDICWDDNYKFTTKFSSHTCHSWINRPIASTFVCSHRIVTYWIDSVDFLNWKARPLLHTPKYIGITLTMNKWKSRTYHTILNNKYALMCSGIKRIFVCAVHSAHNVTHSRTNPSHIGKNLIPHCIILIE